MRITFPRWVRGQMIDISPAPSLIRPAKASKDPETIRGTKAVPAGPRRTKPHGNPPFYETASFLEWAKRFASDEKWQVLIIILFIYQLSAADILCANIIACRTLNRSSRQENGSRPEVL